MEIRDACEQDVPGILEIHNEAVLSDTTIFSDSNMDLASRHQWMKERQQAGLPVLVAVTEEQQVVGYASYNVWRPYEGFRHAVEHRIHVLENRRKTGIGRALMEGLILRARQAGKHVMIATIESDNRPSVHMHQQLGFQYAGHLRQVGYKMGSWRDITLMQLTLQPTATSSPSTP